jgi:hypothetical protein
VFWFVGLSEEKGILVRHDFGFELVKLTLNPDDARRILEHVSSLRGEFQRHVGTIDGHTPCAFFRYEHGGDVWEGSVIGWLDTAWLDFPEGIGRLHRELGTIITPHIVRRDPVGITQPSRALVDRLKKRLREDTFFELHRIEQR